MQYLSLIRDTYWKSDLYRSEIFTPSPAARASIWSMVGLASPLAIRSTADLEIPVHKDTCRMLKWFFFIASFNRISMILFFPSGGYSMQVKIIGGTRCCRQVMLQKLYTHEDPFQKIWMISLDPTEYNGHKTLQLHVNDIDIGFISQRDLRKISGLSPCSVSVEQLTSQSGRKHYNCFLSF